MNKYISALTALLLGISASVFAEITQVVMETTKGNIVMDVYEDKAPKTSAYFLDLIANKCITMFIRSNLRRSYVGDLSVSKLSRLAEIYLDLMEAGLFAPGSKR